MEVIGYGQLNLSLTVFGALSKLCHWYRQGRAVQNWTQSIGQLIFHPTIGQVIPVYKDPLTGKGGLLNYHNQSFVSGSTLLTTISNGNWALTEWQKNHCFLIDVGLTKSALSYLFSDCAHSHGWKTLRHIFIPHTLTSCFHGTLTDIGDSGMEVDLDGTGTGPSVGSTPTLPPVRIVIGEREVMVR